MGAALSQSGPASSPLATPLWLTIFVSFRPLNEKLSRFFILLCFEALLCLRPLAKPLTTNFIKTTCMCYNLCPGSRHHWGLCVFAEWFPNLTCVPKAEIAVESCYYISVLPQEIHKGRNAVCWEPCHPRCSFCLWDQCPPKTCGRWTPETQHPRVLLLERKETGEDGC